MKQELGPGRKRAAGREVWQLHNHDMPANVLDSCNRSGQCKDQRTAERVQQLQEADQNTAGSFQPSQARSSSQKCAMEVATVSLVSSS